MHPLSPKVLQNFTYTTNKSLLSVFVYCIVCEIWFVLVSRTYIPHIGFIEQTAKAQMVSPTHT